MLIHSLSKYLVICFSVSRIELVTRDRVREGWEGYSPCLFGLQSWFKSTSQQRLNYPTATAASPPHALASDSAQLSPIKATVHCLPAFASVVSLFLPSKAFHLWGPHTPSTDHLCCISQQLIVHCLE